MLYLNQFLKPILSRDNEYANAFVCYTPDSPRGKFSGVYTPLKKKVILSRRRTCLSTPTSLFYSTCNKTMAMFTLVFVALVFNFELQCFTAQVVKSSIVDTTFVFPSTEIPTLPLQNDNYSTSNETQLLFRKCCDLGQVYNDNSTEMGYSFQCVNFSGTNHSPSLLNLNPQNLFFTADDNPLEYADKDFDFVTGFPSNCDKIDLTYVTDLDERFYLSGSGQVIFPHSFYYLDFKDYCIEELIYYEDFSKASRRVYFCYNDRQLFPETAITDDGKLQLDFINSTVSSGLLSLAGRTVVEKCCLKNYVIYYNTLLCTEYQNGTKPEFFEDLQARYNDKIFFHIVQPNCPIENQKYAKKFNLTPSGRVQIEETNGKETSSQLLPFGSFCIEDVYSFDSIGLPEIVTAVNYCTEQSRELGDSVHSIDSDTIETIDNEALRKVNLTKCCPPDSVIVGNRCEPLQLIDNEKDPVLVVEQALNLLLLTRYNVSATLFYTLNVSVGCINETTPIVAEQADSYIKITYIFENDFQVSRHYYQENYLNFNEKLKKPCFDLMFIRNLKLATYDDRLFYCFSDVNDSKTHVVIFLVMSSAALIATFIIYFLVPTQSVAKLITSTGATKKRTVQSMANTLTGRILLCHVITLAVYFISLTISQINLDINLRCQNCCIALGYITYGTSMASFTWLVVFCFDYCRIFRGSFKVSSDVLFLPYSAFGWGVPLLALIITSVAQFQAKLTGASGRGNPNIGSDGCWFPRDGKSEVIFFWIPVSLLMILNTIFYVSLLFNDNLMNCMKGNRNSSLRNNQSIPEESKRQQDVKMSLKLFFITGIPWLFEIFAILSFIFLGENSVVYQNLSYVFQFGTLLNSLRGVAIFILFVLLQRDSRRYLWRGLVRHIPSLRYKADLTGLSSDKPGSISNLNDQSNSGGTQLSSLTPSVVSDEEQVSENQPECDEITQL